MSNREAWNKIRPHTLTDKKTLLAIVLAVAAIFASAIIATSFRL